MIILGLETSCDETAAALLREDRVLAHITLTQKIHGEWGGVVPEIASREHLRVIHKVTAQVLEKARTPLSAVDLVAVTRGPGLLGALLVGFHFARGLALSLNRPLVAVNHMEGHIYANFLDGRLPRLPALVLVVSGGHTQLVLWEKRHHYRLLGETRDDAAGEAFDKGAKILGLGYPGGPAVAALAEKGEAGFHRFPRGMARSGNLEMSFSGLKTALLHLVRSLSPEELAKHRADLAAGFQEAVVDSLLLKTEAALKAHRVRQLAAAGGVAANTLLREGLQRLAQKYGVEIVLPELAFCTDNAAMIARAGWERFLYAREDDSPPGDAHPGLDLFAESA